VKQHSSEDKTSERLTEAEKACMRARDLTQQLLTFSRGGAPIKKITSIVNILRDSVNFALSGSRIRCEFSIPDDLWAVEVDEGQITQIINNLIINADQAMPSGGIIRIRAENVNISPKDPIPVKVGEYVKLSIQDEGIGISKEHLPKIFDPYFTTKQKGSGLGLATSYSIIKNHEGHISVESEPNVGTTFHLYIPAIPGKSIAEEKEREKEAPVMGHGKILVMDDEEFIRDLATDMLTNIGYQPTVVENGAKAIQLYKKAKESDKPFNAVILDLTIPGGMSGKEVIIRLKEIDPNIKAVVSSGYSNDPIMSEFKKYGFKGVIAKPYKTKELSEVLYRIINF
jgi:CheY-like chemotaxis protein